MNFRYPVHFVFPRYHDADDILDAPRLPHPSQAPLRFGQGPFCWTMQTYLYLKLKGHNVKLVRDFVPGEICVAFYDDIHLKAFPFRSFLVVLQPDRPMSCISQISIVQNHLSIRRPGIDHLVTLWPQAGIVPRDPERGTRIQRLGYYGRVRYLAEEYQSDEFRRELQKLNVELVIQEQKWNDFSQMDVVMAVRHASPYNMSTKPASKLINAWQAACIPLMGQEPAYAAIRESELDYITVSSPDEIIQALRRLQQEPNLVKAMLEQGRKRAEEFTPDRIIDQWERILGGPVMDAYERWRSLPEPLRTIRGAVAYPWRCWRHQQERKRHWKLVHQSAG